MEWASKVLFLTMNTELKGKVKDRYKDVPVCQRGPVVLYVLIISTLVNQNQEATTEM